MNDPSNYRPISVLSVVSKIAEKIVTNQTLDHLETNSLLTDSQFGFRPKKKHHADLEHTGNRLHETGLPTLCEKYVRCLGASPIVIHYTTNQTLAGYLHTAGDILKINPAWL